VPGWRPEGEGRQDGSAWWCMVARRVASRFPGDFMSLEGVLFGCDGRIVIWEEVGYGSEEGMVGNELNHLWEVTLNTSGYL
jgi:hypothetical protein